MPLVVLAPGRVAPGTRVRQAVSLRDVAATVLDLAGPNREAEGRTWRNVRVSGGDTGWIASAG